MKRNTDILFIILVVLLTSCSKTNSDKENEQYTECVLIKKNIEKTNKQHILKHQYSERWWKKYREILKDEWNTKHCNMWFNWPNSY